MALTMRPTATDEDNQYTEPGDPGLGALLRGRRTALHADIGEIAVRLRIRPEYLQAIEDADYQRLPGLPYAIGFVRSYAAFLGLDANDMVARFKSESDAMQVRSTLNFPSPAPQGRVPGSGPLAFAVVGALVIIGVWYWWRDDIDQFASRIPEVPEHLLALVRSSPSSSGQAPSSPATEPPATSQIETTPPPPSDLAAAPPPAPLPAPTTTTVPAPAPTPSPRPAAPPALTQTPPAAAPSEPRALGTTSEDVRIVLKATGDSWLEIRDRDNQRVLSRLLHAGDVYRVANTTGMVMSVGNSGGLEILVDGAPVPSLGAVGVVRKAIPLDPERLKLGFGTHD